MHKLTFILGGLLNNEVTRIWLQRVVGCLFGALSAYLMLLDFLWGLWLQLQSFSMPLHQLVSRIYHLVHFADLLDFAVFPFFVRPILTAGNWYFFVAYVVFIVSALVVSNANFQAKERAELIREIRREQKKRGLSGGISPQEYRARRKRNESDGWQKFNTWAWAPLIAPIIVIVIAKLAGLN